MKKIELLAPAGNMQALKAAIHAGCDAVYMGGKSFGARNYADNFDKDELVEAINYAHLYDVKIYITVNTIIYESEVKSFMEYIEFLVSNNVDALIMQDLGMIDLVRKTYKNLEIHASTQMNIHSLDGIKFAEKLGIDRVVLARETTIEQIKKIKENSDMPLEVFGHGALCVCYSGQCLMSYLIGKRSGNRGTCAGPCRKKYKLNDKVGYLLSPKDLNVLENIDLFIESGINSLKIEGRVKSPEYIYLVTSIYRKVIDKYYETSKVEISKEDIKKILTIFNRSFTKGFLFNEKNIINEYRPNHLGINIGKIVKKDNSSIYIKLTDAVNMNDGIRILNEKEDKGFLLQSFFVNNKKVITATKGDIIKVNCNYDVNINDNVIKTLDDKLNKNIKDQLKIEKKLDVDLDVQIKDKIYIKYSYKEYEVSDSVEYEFAEGEGTRKEDIIKQLSKLGDSVYKINNVKFEQKNKVYIKISILNQIRRELIEKLNNKRLERIKIEKSEYAIQLPNFKKEQKFGIYSKEKQNIKCDYMYNDEGDCIKLPRILEEYAETNKDTLVSEIGAILNIKNVSTDYSINIVNSYALALLHSLGVKRVCLSVELNNHQIKKIVDAYISRYKKYPNIEMIVDSNVEVMVTKSSFTDNLSYLIDEFNNKYKVVNKGDYNLIYSYNKVNIEQFNIYYELGINCLRKNM